MERGLIQVYTGNGKGKTSAAWGQALRAAGHGLKVAVVRFLKPNDSGEVRAAERLAPLIAVFGESGEYDPRLDQHDSPRVRLDNRRNFDLAKRIIQSGQYDMVVLDEINFVLHYGHVTKLEIHGLFRRRPAHTELVLTGRNAPQWLLDEADLVTEMVDVKHPSRLGVRAREGIEY